MTLGNSLQDRKHSPLEEYIKQWVDVRVADNTIIGVLVEVHDKGYLVLSPFINGSYSTTKLSSRAFIDQGRKMVAFEGFPHVVQATTQERVEAHIRQLEVEYEHARKEFQYAQRKLEEELKKCQ